MKRISFLKGPAFLSRKGNSIIEALVALTIVLVGVGGITRLSARSLEAQTLAADRFTAAYLAEEGIELVKYAIDGKIVAQYPNRLSWVSLADANRFPDGSYEVSTNDTNLSGIFGESRRIGDLTTTSTRPLIIDETVPRFSYDTSSGIPSKFFRTVRLSWSAPCSEGASESLMVSANVTWNHRGEPQNISVSDVFSQWRGGSLVCLTP
jgi:Tfp pilus assembly protein PilV